MPWIVIGVLIVAILFGLVVLSRSGAQEMDEDAMQEAAEAPPVELEQALHPPPKTKEEIEEENEFYTKK